MRADAEFSAPDANSTCHVKLGSSSLAESVSILVHSVFYPADGPHLSVVGVSAELEVHACLFGEFQIVGLVVEENGERSLSSLWKGFLRELCNRLAPAVHSVVAPDDGEIAELG